MSRYRQQGAVLIVSLVLLLIITAIAASTLTSSTFQTVVSNNAQKRDTIFHVAESAAERVLPLSVAVANQARKAQLTNTSYTVTLTTSNQAGTAIPTAKVTYPGDKDGKRNLFLPGVAIGGDVTYIVRNYEIQGDAKTTDSKVGTSVVMGVGKVESQLGGS
jgi:hypothetical protein